MSTSLKVGDTLNAKVDPANATGTLTYVWMADGVAIDTTATTSFTVTSAEIGKKISVKVTGDAGSEVTSAETEPVQAEPTAELTITAKQTGAKTLEITFNKAVDAATKVAVTRGTNAQTVDKLEFATDYLSAKVTLAANIGTGTFTVTATTGASEKAECTFEGELSAISEIKFLNESLVITDSGAKSATAALKGYDQFGEEKTIAGATITATKGEASGSIVGADGKTYTGGYKDGILTLVSSSVAYSLNESVVVSVLYTSGTTPITTQATLTVSSQSAVAEIEFGEITTDKAALKDKRLTADVLGSGNFYVPVTKAKDQYTNDLTADQLNTLKDTSKTLLVSPATAAGVIAYAGQASGNTFDTKDKQVVMYIGAGDAKIKGEQIITVASAGGANTQLKVEVAPYPAIDTLSVEVPDLYVGADAEIVFTATDQYGEAYDMWTAVDYASWTGKTGVEAPTTFNNITSITFTDGTSFTLGGANFTVKKDTNTKKVKFVINGSSLTVAKQTVSFNYVTKSLKTGMGTKSVQDRKVPSEVKGLASTVSTSLTVGQQIDFKPSNVQFFDNYGNKLVAGTDSNYPQYFKSGETATVGKFYYFVTLTSNAANMTLGAASGVAVAAEKQTVPYTAGTVNKSSVFEITLVQALTASDLTSGAANTDYKVIGNNAKVTVSTGEAKNYTVSVKDGKKINLNNSLSDAKLVLAGADAGGSAITVDQALLYNVTFDKEGFIWNNVTKTVNFVAGTPDANAPFGNDTTDKKFTDLPETGQVIASCSVQGYDTPIQVGIDFSKAKAVPKTAYLVDDNGKAVDSNKIDASSITSTLTINKKPTGNGNPGLYYAYIVDDYGDLVTDASLKNNTTGAAATTTGEVAKYVLSKGSVSELIDVTSVTATLTIQSGSAAGLGAVVATTGTVTLADTGNAVATTSTGTITWASMNTQGNAVVKAQKSTNSTNGADGTWTDVTVTSWAQTGNGGATTNTIVGGTSQTTQIVATLTMTRGTYYRLVATPVDTAAFVPVTTTGARFGYLTAPSTLTLNSVGSADGVVAATVATSGATEIPAGSLTLYSTDATAGSPPTTAQVEAATSVACTNLAFPAAVSNTSTLPATAAITAGTASGNYFLEFTPTAGVYAATSTKIYSDIVTATP